MYYTLFITSITPGYYSTDVSDLSGSEAESIRQKGNGRRGFYRGNNGRGRGGYQQDMNGNHGNTQRPSNRGGNNRGRGNNRSQSYYLNTLKCYLIYFSVKNYIILKKLNF